MDETGALLADRIRHCLPAGGITERRMFGGVCFMLRGNMVAGVFRNELLVRVGREGDAAALAEPHARPMEHMGRPAPGNVIVAAAGTATDASLGAWIERAVAHVSTLPAKAAKTTKPAPRAGLKRGAVARRI